jgi:hypothetical protein
MNIDLIINGAFLAFFSFFTAVFLLQRLHYRRKKAANPNHRGFYPSAAALSLVLLSLQTLVQPDLHHSTEQRETETAEEEENGDPHDPASHLNRQLKRIRNGEDVDVLRMPLKSRTEKALF